MKKYVTYWLSTLFLLTVGVGSWSIYNFITDVSDILLSKVGIINHYYQQLTIIFFVFLILLFTGYKLKGAMSRLIK